MAATVFRAAQWDRARAKRGNRRRISTNMERAITILPCVKSGMMRVAVIGVGQMGRHHARVYAGLESVRLVGVCDIERARAEAVAAEFHTTPYEDYRALFDQVDAVTVAVPTEHHSRIGCEFLRRGVAVLMEKPISRTLEEADALIAAAEQANVVLQVGHLERFNPAVQALGEIVTQPRFFETHRLGVFSPRSLDIDVVMDLMIHDLDVILSLVKSEVTGISAVGVPILSPRVDIANARLEFADGCVANITASRISREKVRKLRFFQPHDYVSLDYTNQEVEIFSLTSSSPPQISHRLLPVQPCEPLKAQLESFLRCVRESAPPLVDGRQGRRTLELAMRVNQKITEHAQRAGVSLMVS
ncbi:MAG: Gfo/Idh/MocA family oxidoreductase [Acidobacteriota bacterium]|nr:Gfo/Idh/MocA family oxidoreductase [Acidobacteriota bacterium]